MLKIVPNPDKEYFERVSKAVKDNEGYCPCAILKIPETKCICKEFLDKNTKGFCHCKLYKKVEE